MAINFEQLSFLAKLRELSTEISRSTSLNDILTTMKSKRVLLGVRRKSESHSRRADVYELRKPEEIVIIDDTKDGELFGDVIWALPQLDLERTHSLSLLLNLYWKRTIAFYASLGCEKLSKVVREEYKCSNELNDPNESLSVKNLVLERLPIFLERCTNIQPKITFDSFRKNFEVRVCGGLSISKTFTIGEKITKSQDVWAATKHEEQGGIDLWVSKNAKRDMYE